MIGINFYSGQHCRSIVKKGSQRFLFDDLRDELLPPPIDDFACHRCFTWVNANFFIVNRQLQQKNVILSQNAMHLYFTTIVEFYIGQFHSTNRHPSIEVKGRLLLFYEFLNVGYSAYVRPLNVARLHVAWVPRYAICL